jgi:hypothetical protein
VRSAATFKAGVSAGHKPRTLHALQEGYGVIAVDAGGGSSERTESAALEQIRGAGGVVSSVVSIATALNPDLANPQGQQMFQIVQTLCLA